MSNNSLENILIIGKELLSGKIGKISQENGNIWGDIEVVGE